MSENGCVNAVPDIRPLYRLIRTTRSLLRSSWVATGLGLTVGLWFGALGAMTLTDLLVPLWPAFRLTGLLLVVVPTTWAFAAGVVRPLCRRLRPGQVARRIEKHIPGIHNRLVSCIDLMENEAARHSPAFYRRLLTEALERIKGFRARTVIDFRSLRRAGAFAFVSLAGFGLAFLLLSDRLPTALARIFAPFADIPPASGVVFTVTPAENAKVLRGEDLLVVVNVEKGEAADFRIKLSSEQAAKPVWHELKKVADHRWQLAVNSGSIGAGFERGFHFRVYGGGTWSKQCQVGVLDRPAIVDLHTVLHYPEYMGLPEPKVGPPQVADVTGPEGGQVEVVVQAEGDVKEGEIQFLESRVYRTFAMREVEGNKWSGRFPLHGTGWYRVELRNELGYVNKPMKEGKFGAIADNPPQIALERPGANMTLSTPAKVPVVMAAFDDFGLAEVSLAVQRGEKGAWDTRVIKRYAKPRAADSIVTSLDLLSLGVRTGETIRYHAEAKDRNGQTARTPDFQIRVTADPNAADRQLAELEKSQDPFRQKLFNLIAQQAEVRNQVEKLNAKYATLSEKIKEAEAKIKAEELKDLKVTPQPAKAPQTLKLDPETEKALPALRKELAELAKKEEANLQLGRQIDSDLGRLTDQANKTQMLPKEIAEQLQALQQLFRQRAVHPLQELTNDMKRGADPRQPGDLDLKGMQQTSDRLQKDLEAMKERMKALEEAQKNLRGDPDDALAKLRDDLLRQHGALTARELEDLKNFIAALRDELSKQKGNQEGLQRAAENAADGQLPEVEKKQAGLDKQIDEALDKTKQLQASEKMKRLKRPPEFPGRPSDPEAREENVRSRDEDPDQQKKARQGDKEKKAEEEKEEPFMPALGGPKPTIDPRFANKQRPVKQSAKSGQKSAADQRGQLKGHQEENLNDLNRADQSLASDQQSVEQMLNQLRQAMQPGQRNRPSPQPQQRQSDEQAQDLAQMLKSQALQQALDMANRMRGIPQPGRRPADPNTPQNQTTTSGNLHGAPPPGFALDSELGKLDLEMRKALLKLPPKVREELLQSRSEKGPEGYQEFIDDYFKRLSQGKGAG